MMDEKRIPGREDADFRSLAGDSISILDQMRRRRCASLRLPPLADGRHDPQFDLARDELCPSSFALCRRELEAEVERLRALGWEAWEVATRLHPERLAA